ncbi:MAG: alpha/beta fold hydrolase [Pseudomonadota bacterium]
MSERVDSVEGADGYPLSVRRYEPQSRPSHQFLLLHGVVSHAGWLAPIGKRLAARGIRLLAADRRGAGRNDQEVGDAPSVDILIDDAFALLRHYQSDDCATHFGGFCWGATYALNVLERDRSGVASFVMIAPSIFPASDVGGAALEASDDATARCIPNVPIDRFTQGPDYEEFIVPDPLRTRLVSPRFNQCMIDMNRLLAPRWAKLRMPTLMVLAEQDRLSDNEKHLRAWRHVRGVPKSHIMVPGEHGVQFDAPEQTVDSMVDWVSLVSGDTQLDAAIADVVTPA